MRQGGGASENLSQGLKVVPYGDTQPTCSWLAALEEGSLAIKKLSTSQKSRMSG